MVTPPPLLKFTFLSLGVARTISDVHSLLLTGGPDSASSSAHIFTIGPFNCQHSVLMPRGSRQARASRTNGQNSAASQQVSEQDRMALQTMPQLTMVTASTATVFKDIERADTVRQNRQRASAGWAYVVAHFNEIPLKHEEGEYDNASGDYGGLVRGGVWCERQPPDRAATTFRKCDPRPLGGPGRGVRGRPGA